ncbi:hypothetical protein C8F01DRAFT_429974 [Mycena amicta]|nr:hypothetical protein C8F01DRAFT_429974 [Mycena amicta]
MWSFALAIQLRRISCRPTTWPRTCPLGHPRPIHFPYLFTCTWPTLEQIKRPVCSASASLTTIPVMPCAADRSFAVKSGAALPPPSRCSSIRR